MSIQFKRGTTGKVSSVVPLAGELLIDTDRNTINIGDGATAGGKPLENNSNIAALNNKAFLGVGTVVDAVIYDTSLDSDGGAWRNRCTRTSWYKEVAESGSYLGSMTTTARDLLSPTAGDLIYNTTTATWQKYIADYTKYVGEHLTGAANGWRTTTRGVRAEFPAVVAVIAEAAKVWIFDVTGSEPVLWLSFGTLTEALSFAGGTSTRGIAAYNAVIGRAASVGCNIVSFKKDKIHSKHSGSSKDFLHPIAYRNLSGADYTSNIDANFIVNNACNDIAITVRDNAAIDPATGLPYPTISVCTDGNNTYSTSIIDPQGDGSGTVINVASETDSTGTTGKSCDFGSDGSLTVVRSDGRVYIWNTIPTITGQAPDTTITDALGTVSIVEAA